VIEGPDCGFFGQASVSVQGIDESGRVACNVSCGGGNDRAHTWRAETGLLPIQGFPQGTYLRSISGIANGWVTGYFESTGQPFGHFGFLASGSSLIVIEPPMQPAMTTCRAVNSRGTAVGTLVGNDASAFRWHEGMFTDLSQDLTFGSSTAVDINEDGRITGYMGNTSGVPNHHGFIWHNGKVVDLGLGLPGAFATEGSGINARGEVCGTWWSAELPTPKIGVPFRRRAFHWDGAILIDLPTGTYPESFARDINDQSQIVGSLSVDDGLGGPACMWDDGRVYYLQTMIENQDLGLGNTRAINNQGLIGTNAFKISTQDSVGIVLTPVFPKMGDSNCDGQVNVDDLLSVINHWQADGGREDFNDDGVVNLMDLFEVIVNWG